jgi:hypothetical protein
VQAGRSVTITSTVSGGRSPYTYTITLPGLGPVADKLTDAGEIKREVIVPADAKASEGTIRLEVKDSANAIQAATSAKSLKVAAAPPPAK